MKPSAAGATTEAHASFYPFSSSFLFLESSSFLPHRWNFSLRTGLYLLPGYLQYLPDLKVSTMVTLRGLPLSPPPSSGDELTPERVTDPNGVCVPVYIPHGMEHVKIGELGAGLSSMVTSLFSTDLVSRPNT